MYARLYMHVYMHVCMYEVLQMCDKNECTHVYIYACICVRIYRITRVSRRQLQN